MSGLKQTLKNKINTGKTPDAKILFKRIEKYENVSFDIFDTLLKRKVNNPNDVFNLMQRAVQDKISNFAQKRIHAESQARSKNNSKEITLDSIYDCMHGTSIEQKEQLKKLELKFEANILVPNKEMIDLFNLCKQANKQIYIISDMYLPLQFIEKILKKNNITGYKKIYLSSNEKLTKRSGQIFDLYLKENSFKAEKCIHIGDSWHSDYKIPKSKGISAIHIPRNTIFSNSDILKEQYLNNFIRLNIYNKSVQDPYYKFGYKKFGQFLWGYVKWLHKNFQDANIEKVFFFSRDGYIMKQAYDLLYGELQDNIKVKYLEVSRRSLRVPILWLNSDFESYINMISPSRLVTIQSIFDGAGLDINNYLYLLQKYGFTVHSDFDRNTILQNVQLKNLYSEVLPDIVSKSKEEYKYLREYLEQQHVNGKFAMVDIGWGGSMERYLTQTLNTLGISNDIYGFYIGVADYYKKNVKDFSLKMKGYLFDFMNDATAIDERSSFVGLFESLFLEQDGSVKNYKYGNNGKVVSNRYSYEYFVEGKPTFEYLSIKKIQAGALEFIKDVKTDCILSDLLCFNSNELYSGIKDTGMQPSKRDLDLFADFHFYDEGRDDKLAAPANIVSYIINPKRLKHDFLVSRWKIGFMKRMFKVDLPYQKLYEYMHRFK